MDLHAPLALRGKAVIQLRGIEDREFKGKAVLLVKGPDKVRIEIFDILGQVAAVIISDGSALSIFSENNSKFFPRIGETPLIFTAPELASFLMGKYQVAGAELERRVLFDDYRENKDVIFPYSLSVDDGREKLSVLYSSIELDTELNDSFFIHIVPKPPDY